MSWIRYAIKRLGTSVFVLFSASIVVFSIVRLVPSSPARIMLGTAASPSKVKALRHRLGLDDPVWIQYIEWLKSILTGDLGQSFLSGQDITGLLLARYPASLELALLSILLAIILMLPLGIIAALNHNTRTDHLIIFFSQAGHSVPAFWFGIGLILIFGKFLNLVPPSGYIPIWVDPIANLQHVILPTITLGLVNAAVLTRYLRSELLDELGKDYITTAKAFGHPRKRIIFKYVLKNGMIATITVIGLQFGYMIGALVVIEEVFAYPGVGSLIINSLLNRNYPVIQVSLLSFAATFILINLIVDLIYGWMDPRIRE